MKQLLIILTIIFAIPFSDVFAQHVEPLPNAVLKMDAGYSIKGNKVTAIDKTTLSTKNTSIPSSQAVQTAITSALGSTGNFYKVDPPSTALYSGITSLDTGTVHYGRLTTTPTNNNANFKGKTVYIDRVAKTAWSGYTFSVEDSMSRDLRINQWIDGGGGTFTGSTIASTSAKGTFFNLSVDDFKTDSTFSAASGYNNNGFLYLNGSSYNREYNVNVKNALVNGWTTMFVPLGTLNNVSVHYNLGKLKQYLPYSIVGGDNNKGAIASIGGTWTNTNVTIIVDQADVMDIALNIAPTMVNSTLTIKVANCWRKEVTRFPSTAAMIVIAATTDANSKIIIEGNYLTDKYQVVDIQTNANCILRGTFETKDTTKGAIKLGLTAANVKLQGLLKTGHTESITAAGAYSISVLPGSAANKAVGASVTQVGGTITVNAGY